jgi:uroporphyrinogen decarboxylase
MLKHLPLAKPKPNAAEFIDILMGRSTSKRVPLVEYLVDDVVMKPIMTGMLGREWVDGTDSDSQKRALDNFIAFWYHLGYDFVRFERGLPFAEQQFLAPDPTPGSSKQRAWPDEHHGTIMSWEDFEKYKWPKVEDFDFSPFEYINSHLPEGMGLISCHAAGVFEHLSFIMSLEGLSLALYDAPDLVQAITDAIGGLLTKFYAHLLDLDRLIAIFPGDDMGFRTGTLIHPDALRTYCLPWHKRFAAMTHAKGLPYFLHSCGNLTTILPDLIDDVCIDGKHSYEDAIIPVQDFQARYGGRIAVLGGVDLNRLAAGTADEVRQHTRFLIETCGARGRYAVGSGNSIPSYVPAANYLAMVDEANTMASTAV